MYTLGEAARATGKSKATIHKAIKAGRISAERTPDRTYQIDPSELHRVYPRTFDEPSASAEKEPPANDVLRVQLEAERAKVALLEATVADLREDRDSWRQQAVALLEDRRPEQPQRQRRRWWWFGRRDDQE